MPLQIRRGPTADRLSIVPLLGELVYDTNTQSVFIGDGQTPGGVPITQLSADDVRSITARQFLGQFIDDNSIHTGITFQYVDNRLVATVSDSLTGNFSGNIFSDDSTLVIDGSSGTVYGNFVGNVWADDSTGPLINGANGSINLDGTVKGDIIPDDDEVYDIGSPTNKFKDLYLSGSSLWLGTAQLTSVGSTIVLPSGSTVDGNPLGFELGQEYAINIRGDLRGSVFPDDSTAPTNPEDPDDSTRTRPLVDATEASINLDGTVKGNIIPDLTETRNIGSLIRRFDKLYLAESGSSLWIGNAAIGATGTVIDLPVGSTVGGVPIGSGTGTGDGVIQGSNYKINIVAADSSLLVDSDNNALNGNLIGNVTGNVFGDVTGNIITNQIRSSDSSEIQVLQSTRMNSNLIVDENLLVGGDLTVDNVLNVNGLGVFRKLSPDNVIVVTQVHNDPTAGALAIRRARGTVGSETTVLENDALGEIDFNGYNGTATVTGATIRATVDGTVTGTAVPTRLSILTADANGDLQRRMFFSSQGDITVENGLVSRFGTFVSGAAAVALSQSFDDANVRPLTFSKSRGTIPEPTSVQNNDILGQISFAGYESGAGSFLPVAAIRSRVTSVATNDVRGVIAFQTNNGIDFADRITIGATGRLNAQNGIAITGGPASAGVITNFTASADLSIDTITNGGVTPGTLNLNVPQQSTVGSAGAASALPAQPSLYIKIKVSGVEYVIPAYLPV
jgi:hypothetical protein